MGLINLALLFKISKEYTFTVDELKIIEELEDPNFYHMNSYCSANIIKFLH